MPVDYKDTSFPEIYRIRGFEISPEKQEACIVVFDQPGLCQLQNVSLGGFEPLWGLHLWDDYVFWRRKKQGGVTVENNNHDCLYHDNQKI